MEKLSNKRQNAKFVSISKISINYSHQLYLFVFWLEIKIIMCKIYTTVLISCSNVQCNITEFNMA